MSTPGCLDLRAEAAALLAQEYRHGVELGIGSPPCRARTNSVARSMTASCLDTAQRRMGLEWAATHELVARSSAEAGPAAAGSPPVPAPTFEPDDYAKVYGRLLDQVGSPVILHWLADRFDPALTGYRGSSDHAAATQTFVATVTAHADKVDRVKAALLDRRS